MNISIHFSFPYYLLVHDRMFLLHSYKYGHDTNLQTVIGWAKARHVSQTFGQGGNYRKESTEGLESFHEKIQKAMSAQHWRP